MREIRFCRDCKWAVTDQNSPWEYRCLNPQVNKDDAWALASAKSWQGSNARTERSNTWWFAPCGRKGKQWAPKES